MYHPSLDLRQLRVLLVVDGHWVEPGRLAPEVRVGVHGEVGQAGEVLGVHQEELLPALDHAVQLREKESYKHRRLFAIPSTLWKKHSQVRILEINEDTWESDLKRICPSLRLP